MKEASDNPDLTGFCTGVWLRPEPWPTAEVMATSEAAQVSLSFPLGRKVSFAWLWRRMLRTTLEVAKWWSRQRVFLDILGRGFLAWFRWGTRSFPGRLRAFLDVKILLMGICHRGNNKIVLLIFLCS
jgi:hypothetical protein